MKIRSDNSACARTVTTPEFLVGLTAEPPDRFTFTRKRLMVTVHGHASLPRIMSACTEVAQRTNRGSVVSVCIRVAAATRSSRSVARNCCFHLQAHPIRNISPPVADGALERRVDVNIRFCRCEGSAGDYELVQHCHFSPVVSACVVSNCEVRQKTDLCTQCAYWGKHMHSVRLFQAK